MPRLPIFLLAPLVIASLIPSSFGDDEEVKSATVDGRQVLIAQNHNLCPEMITITADLQNARCTAQLPLTVELPAGGRRELCSFSAAGNAPWHYNFHWKDQLGSVAAKPDKSYVYSLPFPKGSTCQVIQGFNGKFSHTGALSCAIDWKMPVGSPVCAARDGMVVRTKVDSNQGGPSRDFLKMANVITVLHSDGTIGEYVHLQQNGARVTVGQRIKAGDVIGLSGNTGFTDAPHLHFHVYVAVDGTSFQSIPIQYRLAADTVGVPEQGRRYTSE